MNTLKLEIKDKLAIITLDRGRANPMNAEMVAELTSTIKDIANNKDIGGVILTGKENFFSAGLDLMEVFEYDEVQTRVFWTSFMHMQFVLATFRKPMVAAITGHSPAGGCVMAVCCDYRVMAEGKYVIGLNEIPVGIIVPDSIFNLYAFWLGKRKAYQYLLEGKLLSVQEALADGLIDEVCDAADVLAAAEKKIRTYMAFNPVTWSQSKMNLRSELIAQLSADQTDTLNIMLKQWWAPATRQTLQHIIDNLKAPAKKP